MSPIASGYQILTCRVAGYARIGLYLDAVRLIGFAAQPAPAVGLVVGDSVPGVAPAQPSFVAFPPERTWRRMPAFERCKGHDDEQEDAHV
ncbi:MAG TPA: hypothetical protein VGD80_39835 [Kofleriaceae bacterium]